MSVNNTRNNVVVHMTRLTGDHFGDGDAFFLRLVREHHAADDIADGEDTGDLGLEVVIDLDKSPFGRQTDVLKAQPVRVRPPSDGNQRDVGLDLLGVAALGRFDGKRDPTFDVFAAVTLAPRQNFKPCFSKRAWPVCGPRHPCRVERCRGIRSPRYPRRLQTEPSSSPITPAPITTIFFGTLSRDKAPVEETIRFHRFSRRATRRVRTGGDDDVVGFENSFLAVAAHDGDLGFGFDRAVSGDMGDLVFLNRNATPLVRSPTTVSFRFIIVGRSTETLPVLTP